MMLEKVSHVAAQLVRGPRYIALVIFAVLLIAFYYSATYSFNGEISTVPGTLVRLDVDNITKTAKQYSLSEIQPPYKDKFWELGQRSRQLSKWLGYADKAPKKSKTKKELIAAVELTTTSLFPFMKASPRNPKSQTPLSDLRSTFKKGSRGIVIPVGGNDLMVRFAGHLIASLRLVLDCQLPIQIVYHGEGDLPKHQRDTLAALDPTHNTKFLDVWTVFDDSTLLLGENGWAIKPFAALAAPFEQVILLDADAVFLQSPEALFEQRAYVDNGAYLFHDRLLWQHVFRERHDWWRDQIKEPSPAMNKSLVWTQDYAEECDSGVVVLDKSRPEILVGLLHIAWQNAYHVRKEVSYTLTYGDKETWWLGLELAGSKYEFEEHYGSILGWAKENAIDKSVDPDRVCSFVIAHLDQAGRLIWYNGSLLKNKLVNPEGYEVPQFWMTNGKWEKGATKKDMSCMVDSEVKRLTDEEQMILRWSIEEARKVDELLKEKSSQ